LFVSVTRVLNEDDVVEAFVRHSCAHVDHMLLADGRGGSDAGDRGLVKQFIRGGIEDAVLL
jgi:hypothetical protein